MALKEQPQTQAEEALPALEVPDEAVIHINGIVMPILAMTVNSMHEAGKPGWSTFWAQVFDTVNDVMAPES